MGSGRATNRGADVRTVQHLFNRIAGRPVVAENGQCSQDLIARISRFQAAILHFQRPDGRVDPHGRTIKGLLEQAAVARPVAVPHPAAEPSILDEAIAGLVSLRDALRHALARMFDEKTQAKKLVTPHHAANGGGTSGGGALTDADYAQAARRLGPNVRPALLRAFAEVESGGKSGFGPDGLPIIAYEGHVFRRYTHKKYDATHPLLSYPYKQKAGPEWRANNHGQKTAWKTLTEAAALDHDAALMACSWGMFQVMGFNYADCGYKDASSFVEAMKQGARGQLDAFVGYCKHRSGMVEAMTSGNYAGMASRYNGEDYGDYDQRIRRADQRHEGR